LRVFKRISLFVYLANSGRSQPLPRTKFFGHITQTGDRLGDLGIPVVSDLPFGHDGPNAALPVGVLATLDAEQGILSLEEIDK